MENMIACLVALIFCGGSLLVYLTGAAVSRLKMGEAGKTTTSFNLGVPTQRPEELFAISIVSAGTTLSTVSVIFLTTVNANGLHLLFCPISFGLGIWLMLFVYRHVHKHGYIDESPISGLIPALGYRLTRSRLTASVLAGASAIPVLALLTLEIRYGALFLEYLIRPFAGTSDWTFAAFVVFMALLFGYVFVGGFRAVIASDVLQYKAMKISLFLVLLSVLWLCLARRHELNWGAVPSVPASKLLSFYFSVAVLNLFSPLGLAENWQRFRAFDACGTNFPAAIRSAIFKVIPLWITLIAIGLALTLIPGAPFGHVVLQTTTGDQDARLIFAFLDHIIAQGGWFALFVFPLITLSALSGMYSTSDTCVSALLYLTESDRSWTMGPRVADFPLRRQYYWVMAALFTSTLALYWLVKKATGGQGIMNFTFEIFSNVVVIAPTILLLTLLRTPETENQARTRTHCVLCSISLGLIAYWSCRILGPGVLKDWSTVVGFVVALLPAALLVEREWTLGRRKGHA